METLKIVLFAGVALFCLFGCNLKSVDNNKEGGLKNNEVAGDEGEDFESFLIRFSQDSVFQYARVEFPLKKFVYNIDRSSYDTSFVNIDDWFFADILHVEGMQHRVSEADHAAKKLEFYKDDTGMSVFYVFVYENKQWMLKEIRDDSN